MFNTDVVYNVHMNYKAHKIHEHLYQGGYPPEGSMLAKSGIDVLVLCAQELQDATRFPGVEVICCGGDDDERPGRLQSFLRMWQNAAHRVADCVRSKQNVLVTCFAGQNRSGIVTALALQELTGMNGTEIVQHIQSARPFALNNKAFVEYLEETFP